MYKKTMNRAVLAISFAAILMFNSVSATDSPLIARGGEHHGAAGHHVEAGRHMDEHHPAAREAVRHGAERNALNNIGTDAVAPVYPAYPATPVYPTAPAPTINVNQAPSSGPSK